ncbi:MAG: phage holin family protein [Parachlamydiales bacterium]|nr:phage holin family protein [Parachlamydiales bacterium]
MNYLKTLVINFLVVFFANHVLPGILVMDQTKLPHIGGDLIMAASLGLLNTLICPLLKLIGHASALKIALVALILNFAAYAVIKLIPIGIGVSTVEGYLMASVVVAVGSFLTNFFELKRQNKKMEMPL